MGGRPTLSCRQRWATWAGRPASCSKPGCFAPDNPANVRVWSARYGWKIRSDSVNACLMACRYAQVVIANWLPNEEESNEEREAFGADLNFECSSRSGPNCVLNSPPSGPLPFPGAPTRFSPHPFGLSSAECDNSMGLSCCLIFRLAQMVPFFPNQPVFPIQIYNAGRKKRVLKVKSLNCSHLVELWSYCIEWKWSYKSIHVTLAKF